MSDFRVSASSAKERGMPIAMARMIAVRLGMMKAMALARVVILMTL